MDTIKSFKIFLFFCLILGLITNSNTAYSGNNTSNHPCTRACQDGALSMECEYEFYIEWYQTMSKACFDCPFNKTDCERPHCIPADGNPRAVMSVNRQLPGPSVQVCEGDIIIVNVKNHMQGGEGTSIHWHGMHMRDQQYMDGVAMLTQCPIPAHSSFEYRFVADTPGTHFWHSHSGVQRSDGIFGPLVVRQPPSKEPHYNQYDYDLPEHYILVHDWTYTVSVQKFVDHHNSAGDNKPRSMLVNGKGVYTNYTDPVTNRLINTPREIFRVKQGKRHRFRLASNGILNCPIQVSVDEHNLTMIASDGAPFVPIEVESFIVYGGERYDFVIHANQPIGNYWMKFRGLSDCDDNFYSAHQTAILHYEGATDNNPSGANDWEATARSGKLLNPFNHEADENHIPVSRLESLEPDDATSKDKPDVQFFLYFDFNIIDNLHFHHPDYYPVFAVPKSKGHLYTPQVNRIANVLPPSPPLSQLEDIPKELFCNETTVRNCKEEYCECTHTLNVKLGQVIELVLVDEGFTFGASHPMHLHGQYFRVMEVKKLNKSVPVEDVRWLEANGRFNRTVSRPVKKDTVIIPDGGYTVVRFHATNPGFWFLHCHLEWHVEVGMGVIIHVGEQSDLPPVPRDFPKCGSYKYKAPIDKQSDTGERFEPDPKKNPKPTNKGSFAIARSEAGIILLCCFLVQQLDW